VKIEAPWTVDQVVALNSWQRRGDVHPFTCGGDRTDADHRAYATEHNQDMGELVATLNGWFCPVCSYRQTWAHDFMFKRDAQTEH
jgi:hypothetical protein